MPNKRMEAADTQALRLDNQVCFALYACSLAMTQQYKPLLQPLGLTYPQYLVMLVLWEEDGVTLRHVATRLMQKSGSLTPVLKRLEAEGLLNRVRDPGDERSLSLRLTPRGRQLEVEALKVNQCIAACSGLSAQELVTLRRTLQRLLKNLDACSV